MGSGSGGRALHRCEVRRGTRRDVDVSERRPDAGRVTRRLVIGITDLTREEWEKLRERSDDAATGHDTYEEWLAEQEKVIRSLRESGYKPLRVPIRVDELELWLAEHDLPHTSETRARYVGLAAQEMARRR
jgi:hypothetical protein